MKYCRKIILGSLVIMFVVTLIYHSSLIYHLVWNSTPSIGEVAAHTSVYVRTHAESPLFNEHKYLRRVQFQQRQVREFCSDYDESELLYSLPKKPGPFYRHLLRNKDSDILFCFVPKGGCTTLKALFYISQGLLPISVLSQSASKWNNQTEVVMEIYSLGSLNTKSCINSLKNSFKFVMWRNPLERLASSYRDKVQRSPLAGDEIYYIQKEIYIYMKHEKWVKNGRQTPIPNTTAEANFNVPFTDFIDYWLLGLKTAEDEHFQTIGHLCQPCRVNYDFYGNFNNFAEDAQVFIKKLGVNSSYLQHGYYRNKANSHVIELHMYYHQLDYRQKKAVLHLLSKELDFYYRLFPEEQDSHKFILQIEDELPLTFRSGFWP